ncbi:MAG: hypothetical protein IT427_16330 [Pirellulales bacterium]|nr:hypothetical protein [Pirellulales bacterium]
MSTLLDQGRLRQAAQAIYRIDQTGLMSELADVIAAARRQHRRDTQSQTVGTSLYIDGLASALARSTGLPWPACRAAVADAIAPDWPTVALEAIIAFAGEEVTR